MRERAHVANRLEELRRELEERERPVTAFGRAADVVKEEIRVHERELAAIDDRDRESQAAADAFARGEAARTDREEAAFWFRRFFTTLGIANGAAFAALASGLLQADDPAAIAHLVGRALNQFIWGILGAGSIPLFLWMRLVLKGYQQDGTLGSKPGWSIINNAIGAGIFVGTLWSVVGFCWGLFLAVGAVNGLAEGKKVADARVVAESKAHVHPTAPSALAPNSSR